MVSEDIQIMVQGAPRAIEQVWSILKGRQGAGSARSIGILFKNNTKSRAEIVGGFLQHGEDTQGAEPPEFIEPHKGAAWMVESHGAMTGVEGHLVFEVSGHRFAIHFSNPFVGSNTNEVRGIDETPYQVDISGGDGDNAEVTYTLGETDSLLQLLSNTRLTETSPDYAKSSMFTIVQD